MRRCRAILEISRGRKDARRAKERSGENRGNGMEKRWRKGEVCERDRAHERGWRFAAKRDAVIRRYWQFSRSITGTRKEKILRLKFIEGVERAEQGEKK